MLLDTPCASTKRKCDQTKLLPYGFNSNGSSVDVLSHEKQQRKLAMLLNFLSFGLDYNKEYREKN